MWIDTFGAKPSTAPGPAAGKIRNGSAEYEIMTAPIIKQRCGPRADQLSRKAKQKDLRQGRSCDP